MILHFNENVHNLWLLLLVTGVAGGLDHSVFFLERLLESFGDFELTKTRWWSTEVYFIDDSAQYALHYIISTQVRKLYHKNISEVFILILLNSSSSELSSSQYYFTFVLPYFVELKIHSDFWFTSPATTAFCSYFSINLWDYYRVMSTTRKDYSGIQSPVLGTPFPEKYT